MSYPKTEAFPAAFVCNTNDGDEPGEHWIALYLVANIRGEYFCSYGLPPARDVPHLHEKTLLRMDS